MNRLFVYGTLRPGQSNAHIMDAIGGQWQQASVNGFFYPNGCGAAEGFPGIVIDSQGPQVQGFLFSSEKLDKHWQALDEFEEGYDRILIEVTTADKRLMSAWVYQLQPASIPPAT